MGQVTKLRLSFYLVLLSSDSKPGNKTAAVSWPDPNATLKRDINHTSYEHTSSAMPPAITYAGLVKNHLSTYMYINISLIICRYIQLL